MTATTKTEPIWNDLAICACKGDVHDECRPCEECGDKVMHTESYHSFCGRYAHLEGKAFCGDHEPRCHCRDCGE